MDSKFYTGAAAGGGAGRNQHFHRAPDGKRGQPKGKQREVFRNRRFLNGALPTLPLYYPGPPREPSEAGRVGKGRAAE